MNVLKGFDIKKYKPAIIVLEFLDNDLKKHEFYNLNIQKVLSSEIYKFMLLNDYSFVSWLGFDLIFVNNGIKD
jgi:hypothetical protein